MEEIVVRPRYPRRSITKRVRRRNPRNPTITDDRLKLQIALSVTVLVLAVILKSINVPFTNYLVEKVRNSISYNVDVKTIFDGVNGAIERISGKKSSSAGEDEFKEKALPVNASSYVSETDGSIIEYGEGADANIQDASTEKSNGLVSGVKSENSGRITEGLFIVPASGTLGSPYGSRLDPISNTAKFHKGVDIEAAKGASIKAVMAGEVLEAGVEKTYGNYIKLKHTGGMLTVYAHCSKLLVKKGQKVKQGDIIANVGDTGASVGAHLHFEIWRDSQTVNPMDYIRVYEK